MQIFLSLLRSKGSDLSSIFALYILSQYIPMNERHGNLSSSNYLEDTLSNEPQLDGTPDFFPSRSLSQRRLMIMSS